VTTYRTGRVGRETLEMDERIAESFGATAGRRR
jgi:hypothetical protein